MWNVLIFEPFSGAGSLTVEVLDSGTTGLLGFMASAVLEMGSTEAKDRVHMAGTAVRRTAILARARVVAMMAEVVEVLDGESV